MTIPRRPRRFPEDCIWRLAERFGQWGDRCRERRCLATLDGRMLADMGAFPSDAAEESAKPFWKV